MNKNLNFKIQKEKFTISFQLSLNLILQLLPIRNQNQFKKNTSF